MPPDLSVATDGRGWIELSARAASLRVLAEATLALVLFSDASRLDMRALRDRYACPLTCWGLACRSRSPWGPWRGSWFCRTSRWRRRWCSIVLALANTHANALTGSEAARVIAEPSGYGLLMGALAGRHGAE